MIKDAGNLRGSLRNKEGPETVSVRDKYSHLLVTLVPGEITPKSYFRPKWT